MADKTTDYASLDVLKRRVEEYWQNKSTERAEINEGRRYYHGRQYTREEIAILKRRRQPIVVYNREAGKIDGIVGLMERLRQDPRAYSRTPERDEPVLGPDGQPVMGPDGKPQMKPSGAEIATIAINYVLDANDWHTMSAQVARDGGIEAVAGIALSLERGDNGDPDIRMELLDCQSFFYDGRSISLNPVEDARFMGLDKWIDVDALIEMFPDREDDILELVARGDDGSSVSWSMDRDKHWINSNERKIRVVEIWYKHRGDWKFCFLTGQTKFMEGVSPFVDEKEQTFPRFVVWSMAIDQDGDRYAFHRNLKGPQDEINHRRSKGLHALNARRVYIEAGTVEDPEGLRDELHRPDALAILPPGAKVDEKSNAEQVAGNMEMLADAKAEIDNYGANPALVGAVEQKSGRASIVQQQAAVAQLGPYIVGFRGWKLRVYRAVWFTIQRYWTAERWIRVTDDEGLAQFIRVNGAGIDPMGRPVVENALGSVDVDIVIDEAPDTITLMQDVYDTLQSLARAGTPIPPEALIEMSGLPQSMKKRLLGMIAEQRQAQQQQANPLQQMAAQLQLRQQAADVENTQANTAKMIADARKTGADTLKTTVDARATQANMVRELFAPPEMPAQAGAQQAYPAG